MQCRCSELFPHLESMRERWNYAKISFLLSHLIYIMDEITDVYPEKEELKEAELLLSELCKDMKRLFPDRFELYTRPAIIKNKIGIQENDEESDDCC